MREKAQSRRSVKEQRLPSGQPSAPWWPMGRPPRSEGGTRAPSRFGGADGPPRENATELVFELVLAQRLGPDLLRSALKSRRGPESVRRDLVNVQWKKRDRTPGNRALYKQ